MPTLKGYARGIWNGRLILAYTFLVSLALFILMPIAIIFLKSVGKDWFGKRWFPPTLTLDWYNWAMEIARLPEVMKNTLVIAALAVLISTVIGICAGEILTQVIQSIQVGVCRIVDDTVFFLEGIGHPIAIGILPFLYGECPQCLALKVRVSGAQPHAVCTFIIGRRPAGPRGAPQANPPAVSRIQRGRMP